MGDGDGIAVGEFFHTFALAVTGEGNGIADAHGIDILAAAQEGEKLLDHLLGEGDVFRIAGKFQFLAAQGGGDGELLLKQRHVAVVHAEQLLVAVNTFQR